MSSKERKRKPVDCNDVPLVVGKFHLDGPPEMMAYLYFPMWIPGSRMVLEPRLEKFRPLINAALAEEMGAYNEWDYAYITAKTLFVGPNTTGNRPGWHCDGYGTGDVNYIWCDSSPTIYNKCGKFVGISADHEEATRQFDEIAEANPGGVYDLGTHNLVRLTDGVVHHTPKIWVPGVRTFVKITFSQNQFNLAGNTRNYGLDYDWTLFERGSERNMENKLADFVKV
jgi:hypothetical protein